MLMFQILFLVFIIVPIIEIAVLMQVGELIGGWPTVGVVILTAWLGAIFVRQQGIATVQKLQTKMAQGQAPSEEIVAGLLLLVAGVFLVTPGFVTDAFGLSLLIPQVRKGLIKSVQHRIITSATNGAHFNTHQHSEFEHQNPFEQQETPKAEHQGKTIDGEFERKE